MRIFVITKKTIIISAIITVCIILAIILVAAFTDGSPQREGNSWIDVEQYKLEVMAGKHKELPVYSVARDDKKIALTIDAAWEDDKTPFILQELGKYNIKATFFLCGFWVEKYPDNVKAIHAAGHEIGNHSLTHPHMNKMGSEQIKDDLTKFDDLLESVIGVRAKNFRAPYGEYNDNVIKTVRSMGYEVIQWDIDTIDWKPERSSQTILDTVLPKLHDGCIILCHNNGLHTAESLPLIFSPLLSQGYEFVKISDLIYKENYEILPDGRQKSSNNATNR